MINNKVQMDTFFLFYFYFVLWPPFGPFISYKWKLDKNYQVNITFVGQTNEEISTNKNLARCIFWCFCRRYVFGPHRNMWRRRILRWFGSGFRRMRFLQSRGQIGRSFCWVKNIPPHRTHTLGPRGHSPGRCQFRIRRFRMDLGF